MKKLILLCSALIVASLGCNTIKGIGEDIKSIGSGLSSMSEKVSDSLDKSDSK